MLAVGNDELKTPLGSSINCRNCGERHPVEYGDEILPDGTKQPSKLLAFYKCEDKSYLAGINGMKIQLGGK